MVRIIAASAIAALCLLSVEEVLAGDPNGGPLKLSAGDDGAVSWQDQQSEASYHVSGSVDYWPPPSCGADPQQTAGEHQTFDQFLPAGTTDFDLPPPSDARLTLRKQSAFTIEALDADGNVIVRDGFGSTADPFCTEAALAAAGSGPASAGGANIAVLAAILVVGVGGVAGGAIVRRRARSAP